MFHIWRNGIPVEEAKIFRIQASRHFGAAVDASLLVNRMSENESRTEAAVYDQLAAKQATSMIGFHDGELIADLSAYRKWRHLRGSNLTKWRSGIKHDCSKIMELEVDGNYFVNGLGERVRLEQDYVFPVLTSSEVANGKTQQIKRWMIVPQRSTGDDTGTIERRAPLTWRYLCEHGELLDNRRSSIYTNRPRFSIFGVGEYSFAEYKVAIAGFYKRLSFAPLQPAHGKPIVLDDSCYFLPCKSEPQARELAAVLNSAPAQEFFRAYVFWDAKRPVTVDLLRRLDLFALLRECQCDPGLLDGIPIKVKTQLLF